MDIKMLNSWACLLILCTLIAPSISLPTSLKGDTKKTDQITRTKPKRAQETLMFGNQQNRQPENRGNPYISSAEKRALNVAGLDALKASLAKENKFSNPKSPRNSLDEREVYNPYDKNYEYGKVIVTEEGDEMPHVWDVAPYSRYYMSDDRRKRSEKSIPSIRTTTISPTSTGYHMAYQTQNSPIQAKKSIPIYAEPRYKREVDIHPEPAWTLLSMWENGHRNRYANEEYDNEEDTDPMEEEDPRNALAWMNVPGYSSYRYGTDTLSPSDIGIVHTHPSGYYEQYENQYGQQLDNGAHPYANQYGTLYSQDSYYPTERKYMVAKKRAPSYDPYVNIVPLQMGIQPRGYPPYPHHMVY
uniref:prohormone-2-like isoform X2 n=1 Tax=Vespula vulgaris TaxID=7454 RepID=UPI002122C382|nr:prohormone-2-like isoform X2 [Vespula vulgaris]